MAEEQELVPSDILGIMDHYGLEYHAVGNVHVTNCIFHPDDTPSMVLYPETNSFYCFGCCTSGTPENIVMKMEDCSYAQAVKMLYGTGYEWFKLKKKAVKTPSVDMSHMYQILGRNIKKKVHLVADDKIRLDKAKELIVKYLKQGVEPNQLFNCLKEVKSI